MMTKTKSPFKDTPLRYAAQSSVEAIDDLLDEKVLLYFTAIMFVSTQVGWGVMWVLEPKAFRKFVDAQQVKLRDEDVKLASYHLSRHIRTSSK